MSNFMRYTISVATAPPRWLTDEEQRTWQAFGRAARLLFAQLDRDLSRDAGMVPGAYDLLVSAQAWHWVDPVVAMPKAAALLRPGGTLALFWNYAELFYHQQGAEGTGYVFSSLSRVLASMRSAVSKPSVNQL